MTEAKALKLSRKLNEIAKELNGYNQSKIVESLSTSQPEDFDRPPVLPCTAIINGYVYIVDCKTGEVIP